MTLTWQQAPGLIVDLFAGGGGASTGIAWALGRAPDHALNHSWDALRVHNLNHPDTQHHVDDVRSAVPLVITRGAPVDVLWASPDCRHFSRAKGGKPCHPEVRSLPWEIVRWARETRPRLVAMENVPEMRTWGPLDAEGHPIKEQAGETWQEWIAAFEELGYHVGRDSDGQAGWKLRACDYGAPTTRERLFIVARRDALPVRPEPTHGPGRAHPHRTAAECIDWSDLGESIFDERGNTRHAAATLRRIATGVMRYVVDAKRPFLIQTGYGERQGQTPRTYSVDAPHPTVVAGGSKTALVSAFLAKHYGGVVGHPVTRPLGAVTTRDHHSVVAASLIRTDNTSDGRLRGLAGVDEPLTTATTRPGHAIVAAFLSTYYGQSVGQPVDAPMGTQTTRHRHAVVTVEIDGVTYAIVDIRMRMLKASELKLAQGFPADYRLEGSEKLKVRLIGNSVPPQLAAAVVAANTPTTHKTRPRFAVA